jgi:hypothetical protein
MKTKTKNRIVPSMRAAATELNTTISVLKRLKAKNAAGFRANGNVDLDELTAWMRDHKAEQSDANDKEALEMRKLKAQCEKLEHELAVSRGDYIHRSDMESDAIRVADLVRTELLAFHADQVTWEGLPAVERDKRGKECVRRFMSNLKGALTKSPK